MKMYISSINSPQGHMLGYIFSLIYDRESRVLQGALELDHVEIFHLHAHVPLLHISYSFHCCCSNQKCNFGSQDEEDKDDDNEEEYTPSHVTINLTGNKLKDMIPAQNLPFVLFFCFPCHTHEVEASY